MSAKGYLGLAPGSAYILKCEADPSFFLPHEKYFKYRYPSRDIWSFFSVAIEGSAFYVHSGFAITQSGVCSGSAWGLLWVHHNRPEADTKSRPGLVTVCFLLGWVWSVPYFSTCIKGCEVDLFFVFKVYIQLSLTYLIEYDVPVLLSSIFPFSIL